MSELLKSTLAARGGLDRWDKLRSIRATFSVSVEAFDTLFNKRGWHPLRTLGRNSGRGDKGTIKEWQSDVWTFVSFLMRMRFWRLNESDCSNCGIFFEKRHCQKRMSIFESTRPNKQIIELNGQTPDDQRAQCEGNHGADERGVRLGTAFGKEEFAALAAKAKAAAG